MKEYTPEEAARALEQMGADFAKNFTQTYLSEAADVIRKDITHNFEKSVSPADIPWLPLKHPRPTGGNIPLVNSGELMRSSTMQGEPGHIEEIQGKTLTFGVRKIQAPLMHYGGTVTPKKAKYLTIPVTEEATHQGARNFPRRLFPLLKAGKPVALAEKQGGSLLIHYLLRKSVTIPARPFMAIGQRLWKKLSNLGHAVFRRLAGLGDTSRQESR